MEITLLFESVNAAREVAYMLQAQWDECNEIRISSFDSIALETAASLANTTYCNVGASCCTAANLAELASKEGKNEMDEQSGFTYRAGTKSTIASYSILNSLSEAELADLSRKLAIISFQFQ